MDLPTEIWIHIISDFFATYCTREKIWLQNIAILLRSTEDDDSLDLDVQPASIYARQKEVYHMAFQFMVSSKQFEAVMQSRQIWRQIFDCTVGTWEWLQKAPQEFEVRLESDYLLACKFLRTFHFQSFAKHIVGHNAIQQYFPDTTKNLKQPCDKCDQRLCHEHFVKFNARTQKLVELKNWPYVENKMQAIDVNRKYMVITSQDQILLFDIENDCVSHKFSADVLPRQFHLFFINMYTRKIVFALQGLATYLRTLILDLDKGLCVTNDDISTYISWPNTPYYVSKHPYNLKSDVNEIKVLNDDNSFTTLQFEGIESEDILKTEKSVFIKFIDNRMIVWVEDQGVYEVNPITRKILNTLPYIQSLENKILLGSFLIRGFMDPEEYYSRLMLQDIYTGKRVASFRFRSIFTGWNSLLNDEPVEEPSMQVLPLNDD